MPPRAAKPATDGRVEAAGSLVLPPGHIAGATGAGDAFAAGCLYGLHESWSLAECLRLGVCAAAACLSHATPSGGLRPVEVCLALAEKCPAREFNVIPSQTQLHVL